ncbi:hypothetical protein GGI15_003229 [Coemansia interrupta]|uniref:Uncharacterized protein n=1 Tax=Coemansia interrupta TaxID=1126814 RepID=A0A9W8HDQ8_9FUNG|nr:hypothetical protein GGI15_003229 [Coemansia interrupta]
MTRIAPDKSALIALHDHVREPGLEKQALAGGQTHAAGGAKRRERGRSRSGPMVGDRQARAKVAARRRLELAAGQCGAADMAGSGLGKIDPVVVAGARPGKYRPAPIGQKPLGGMLDGAAAAADCGVWSGSPLLGLQIGEYGKAHGLQVARGGIPGTADEPSFSLFSSSFLD